MEKITNSIPMKSATSKNSKHEKIVEVEAEVELMTGSTNHNTGIDTSKITPAMRQYVDFKKQHPDCILFFRMGDFYEMFYDDAILCNRVLGITLTERSKGVPMAGVPYHAVESYLRKMIEQGYRVAIADQIQDPKEAKGVVDRAVTRILTPGTLVDDTLLDDAQTNHVAAVLFTEVGDNSSACLAVAELSTGTFELLNVSSPDALQNEAARLGINELLYVETSNRKPPPRVQHLADVAGCTALTGRASWHFRRAEAFEAITKHFGVTTLTGFGLADDDPAIGPAGALLRYLAETQAIDGDNSTRLGHIRPPHRRITTDYLVLDAVSLRSLEIERTMQRGEIRGSLLGTMQRCVTPMGKRLLRQWLCFPLLNIPQIQRRQRAVGAFVDDHDFADNFNKLASEIQDVARISARLCMHRATPRDLVALGRSVSHINQLADLLEARPAFKYAREILISIIDELMPIAANILKMCIEHPPAHMREGGLVNDGVDNILDEARTLQRDANNWLAHYQQKLINETGIPSLKVGYNKVFGYYIEITKAQSNKAPDTFSRKQTLKNAERYITPPLKEFETKVLNARQNAIDREQKIFDQLCTTTAEHSQSLTSYANIVGELDVLACFGKLAVKRGYVRPEIVEQPCLRISAGRHPVLDELLEEPFVPNDCVLQYVSANVNVNLDDESGGGANVNVNNNNNNNNDDKDEDEDELIKLESNATLALITGPNMAGKSTYIRQIALLTLLAHTGSYIPAKSAVIGLTDRIFTRIGASDELHAGRSTFMVEMTEAANILHHATANSLVILDEIGRGTSTLDGLSLAWAIAEQLAEIGARTLFATHYHELTSIADRFTSVRNLHVAVREWDEEIIFLYRILQGRTDKSYGIHVAKIAGVPSAAIARAKQLLTNLEVQTERVNPDTGEKILKQNETMEQPRDTKVGLPAGNQVGLPAGNQMGLPVDTNVALPVGTQMALFTEYVRHPVLDELEAVDIEGLTPLEAFEVIKKLQSKLRD